MFVLRGLKLSSRTKGKMGSKHNLYHVMFVTFESQVVLTVINNLSPF